MRLSVDLKLSKNYTYIETRLSDAVMLYLSAFVSKARGSPTNIMVKTDIYISLKDCPTAKRRFHPFCGAKQPF